jgi:hypothetical protein
MEDITGSVGEIYGQPDRLTRGRLGGKRAKRESDDAGGKQKSMQAQNSLEKIGERLKEKRGRSKRRTSGA